MFTEEVQRKSSPATRRRTDSLLDVVRTLFRWKKEILLTCGIAGLGAVIIALLLPVYYQADTTFLVLSPDRAKPELLFGRVANEPEIYGNVNDIDRLISIAESNELIDHLVDSFDLYQHYDIDSSGARAPFYVRREFRSRYEVVKTKRDAVQLLLEDRDPVLAAAMVRAAREEIDHIAQNLIKAGQQRTIETYQRNIDDREVQLRVLADTLSAQRQRFGIYNIESQSEKLTEQVTDLQAQLNGSRARLEAFRVGAEAGQRRFRDSVALLQVTIRGLEEEKRGIDTQLVQFNAGSSTILTTIQAYNSASGQLADNRERLKQYQAAYRSDLASILVLEEATPPLVKSRPHRTLLVVGAVAVAFLFSIIGVLLIENTRDINWREIYYGR